MRRAVTAFVAAGALVLGAAGCSDDGRNEQRDAIDDAAPDTVVEVRFDGTDFDPAQVTVPAGSAIDLVNDSGEAARFVADGFDTGEQGPGDSVRLTFPDEGRLTFTSSGATVPALDVVVEPAT